MLSALFTQFFHESNAFEITVNLFRSFLFDFHQIRLLVHTFATDKPSLGIENGVNITFSFVYTVMQKQLSLVLF